MPDDSNRGHYVFIPEGSDALLLLAPKGKLGSMADHGTRHLRDDLLAGAVLMDVLEYSTEGFIYQEPLPLGESFIRLVEKLVKLLNGKIGDREDLEYLEELLRPHALRRENWPVLARAKASSLPPDYREFALRKLRVGSQTGALKKRNNPNIMSKISNSIFLKIQWILDDPEHRNWPYGYLREVPPPLSLSDWNFWTKAISDDLTLEYGDPEAAAIIRKRRFEFEKAQPGFIPIFSQWDRTPEMMAEARKKLRREKPEQQVGRSRKSQREAAWDFAKIHPVITEHLGKIRSGEITRPRGLFNLFKREILKAVKHRVSLLDTYDTARPSPA